MVIVRYNGAVLPGSSGPFPYIAVVTDNTGTAVRVIPVRSMPDGEEAVIEAIKDLDESGKGVGSGCLEPLSNGRPRSVTSSRDELPRGTAALQNLKEKTFAHSSRRQVEAASTARSRP